MTPVHESTANHSFPMQPGECVALPQRSAVGSASDSRTRGPGFDTRSGHLLSFQEGQLSVTGESMCT